jgi:hypothetical protein
VPHADVAQSEEQLICNQQVESSSLSVSSMVFVMSHEFEIGDLVQYKHNETRVGLIVDVHLSSGTSFEQPYVTVLWASTGKKTLEFYSELIYAEKR